jgi:hypothetical protein
MNPLAIVSTHYRLPEKRLREFFGWNDYVFRTSGASVYIVSDTLIRNLPNYAQCLLYPQPMERFALSRTSNYGIRHAIEQGAEIVIKTDPDIFMPVDMLFALSTIPAGVCGAPVYYMADTIEQAREHPQTVRAWIGSRGTIAMHAADWQRVRGYDERMTGYGPEDGDLTDRCARSGISEDRMGKWRLYHIAHEAGTPQQKGQRADYWNRGTFNPENRKEINTLRDRGDWIDPQWGRPENRKNP